MRTTLECAPVEWDQHMDTAATPQQLPRKACVQLKTRRGRRHRLWGYSRGRSTTWRQMGHPCDYVRSAVHVSGTIGKRPLSTGRAGLAAPGLLLLPAGIAPEHHTSGSGAAPAGPTGVMSARGVWRRGHSTP
jgi:hypothetical protein